MRPLARLAPLATSTTFGLVANRIGHPALHARGNELPIGGDG